MMVSALLSKFAASIFVISAIWWMIKFALLPTPAIDRLLMKVESTDLRIFNSTVGGLSSLRLFSKLRTQLISQWFRRRRNSILSRRRRFCARLRLSLALGLGLGVESRCLGGGVRMRLRVNAPHRRSEVTKAQNAMCPQVCVRDRSRYMNMRT